MKTLIHVETDERGDVTGATGFAWPEGRTWILQWAPGTDIASDLGPAIAQLCRCCQEDFLITGATRSFPPLTMLRQGGMSVTPHNIVCTSLNFKNWANSYPGGAIGSSATPLPEVPSPDNNPATSSGSWRDREPLL